MPEIQVLDKTTIDKIAAGEVVEKPYSVVKELVENAIDAGSSAITIEIKDGGTSFIRITDNGCGIEKLQLEMAFLRHSTSKIRKVEDLISISSLGFRGEALSSISAVAQVEVITKTANSFIGSRYEIHGGEKIAFEEIGAPDGTTFIVRNLFYNTPARKKFLKTPITEGNYIQGLVERLALSHPEISFKFISNNQMKMHTSGNCNLKDIIYQIYGRDIASNLIEVSFEAEEASIKGFIGKPLISRGNRQYENYFVNGRYVKSNIVSKAIEQGYKTFLMQHKYPFTVLLAQFEGKYLDVNVHPTKMELRFSDEEKVFQLFYHVIYDSLSHKELISSATVNDSKENKNPLTKDKISQKKFAEPFEKKRLAQDKKEELKIENERAKDLEPEQSKVSYNTEPAKPLLREHTQYDIKIPEKENKITQKKQTESAENNENFLEESDKNENNIENLAAENSEVEVIKQELNLEKTKTENKADDNSVSKNQFVPDDIIENPKQMSMFEEKLVEKSIRDEIKIVGQVFDTYWIIEYQEKMYIIDQHAAHEKVMYERMMKQLENKEFTSQLLNPPLVITTSATEAQVLEDYKEEFERFGYEIEPFGGKEYAIRAIPGNLLGLNEKEIFLEMLDDLSVNASKSTPEMILDKIASMSCKAAVKGNMKLSFAEAKELLLELMELENPYNCPHGRPVIVSISKYEMEKKFKRIV